MFVSAEDFKVRPLTLVNLDDDDIGVEFDAFVAEWEFEHLHQILGSSLYNAFINGLNDLPEEWNPETAYAIDDETVYGVDVWKAVTGGTLVDPPSSSNADWVLVEAGNKWLTLKKGGTYVYREREYHWVGMKESLRNGVYSDWLRYGVTSVAGVGGTIESQNENSKVVNSGVSVSAAWNKYSRYIGDYCAQRDTLYGFLMNASTNGTFDDSFDESFKSLQQYLQVNFKRQGKINPFGL